jgi:hypothetical protein
VGHLCVVPRPGHVASLDLAPRPARGAQQGGPSNIDRAVKWDG